EAWRDLRKSIIMSRVDRRVVQRVSFFMSADARALRYRCRDSHGRRRGTHGERAGRSSRADDEAPPTGYLHAPGGAPPAPWSPRGWGTPPGPACGGARLGPRAACLGLAEAGRLFPGALLLEEPLAGCDNRWGG